MVVPVEEHDLAAALVEAEEERQEGGAEQEPGADVHVDRDGARRGAPDVPGGEEHHVEDHDVLE